MIQLPGWVERVVGALRTVLSNPDRTSIRDVPIRSAGVIVDHDSALTCSAYFRAIAYISSSVGGLPWDVVRETDRRTIKLQQHPVWWMLRTRPNPEMSALAWRESMIAWALSWGNGYSEIEMDQAYRPLALWPISPDRVRIRRGLLFEDGNFQADDAGEIIYEVSNYGHPHIYLTADRMFHLHGLGFDGLQGYSILSLAARTLGLSIAADRYSEDFFANGAVSTGAITHPKHLTPDAHDNLKKDFEENHVRFGKKWRPMIFEEGMKWETMSIPFRDAQMLETRLFQVSDIARWFGLPPHKLADLSRATFSNIEEQNIEVVTDAFMPWALRLEQEADYKLFSGRERGIRTKINIRARMRGNDASRSAYYQVMRNIGVYSTNDIRRLEDMDPVGPEGDELLVQLNQTTLKQLVAGTIQSDQQVKRETVQQGYFALLISAYTRILRREINRFEQNKHKFAENGGLQAWIESFFSQHQAYIADSLESLVASIVLLYVPSDQTGNVIRPMLDAAIRSHLDETKETLLSMGAGTKKEFEIDNRAKREAEALLEHIFASLAQRKLLCNAKTKVLVA